MTHTTRNSIKATFQEALSKERDFLKKIAKSIIQQLMEKESDQQVGVLSQGRDHTKRKDTRNGYKPSSFYTRVGNPSYAKSQIREFAFQTQLFENDQRSESALLAGICQMVTQGVSIVP